MEWRLFETNLDDIDWRQKWYMQITWRSRPLERSASGSKSKSIRLSKRKRKQWDTTYSKDQDIEVEIIDLCRRQPKRPKNTGLSSGQTSAGISRLTRLMAIGAENLANTITTLEKWNPFHRL